MAERTSHHQGGDLLAVLHVPQPRSGVHTSCGHQSALRVECQADLHQRKVNVKHQLKFHFYKS